MPAHGSATAALDDEWRPPRASMLEPAHRRNAAARGGRDRLPGREPTRTPPIDRSHRTTGSIQRATLAAPSAAQPTRWHRRTLPSAPRRTTTAPSESGPPPKAGTDRLPRSRTREDRRRTSQDAHPGRDEGVRWCPTDRRLATATAQQQVRRREQDAETVVRAAGGRSSTRRHPASPRDRGRCARGAPSGDHPAARSCPAPTHRNQRVDRAP